LSGPGAAQTALAPAKNPLEVPDMTHATFATLALAFLVGTAFTPLLTTTDAEAAPRPVATKVWAFCGVHPDAPNAWLSQHNIAAGGVTATFGPCLPPDWTTYTTAEPGVRYATPLVYSRLIEGNASVGMDTIVYDARLWNTDPATRQQALDFWTPQMNHIAAWDMGDEFDPRYADWPVLVERWATMVAVIQPATGVAPFTNHLPDETVLDLALVAFGVESLSFDSYDYDQSISLARHYSPQTERLMVAINALDHFGGTPTAEGITVSMQHLAAAGADDFLIFGGGFPYNADLTPDVAFNGSSMVDSDGHDTPWAAAVLAGSRS
jgi:hypothetical protein